MNYAIYFNKKYERTGHLWQGRFKSWYVTNEAYLYMLMRYIEQNPLKAKMVKDIKSYPYCSYHHFLKQNVPECLRNAWIVRHYKEDKKAIETLIESSVDTDMLQELKKASALVEAPNTEKKPDIKKLEKMLSGYENIKERNKLILKAYNQGYSQHMIAKVLGISQPAVYGVIKRNEK